MEVFNAVVPTPADEAFPKLTLRVLATYVLAVDTVGWRSKWTLEPAIYAL